MVRGSSEFPPGGPLAATRVVRLAVQALHGIIVGMAANDDAATALARGTAATEDASAQFANLKMATILSGETNARGIPFVAFIESVDACLAATSNGTVETLIGAFNELHQKFKILEGHKARTKVSMKTKVPEIGKTLELVRHLKSKHEAGEDFQSHYSLSEMIYGRAKVTPEGTVCLWLGANVMVEYPYEEALSILELSLDNAKKRLAICDEDLDMLRDQIITVEVNMARVFNYDVKKRREDGKKQTGGGAPAIAAN